MELNFKSFNKILFWNYFEYLSVPLIPAFWLIFALKYTENEHRLNKKIYTLIYAIPVITIVLRYTNNLHHLIYKTVSLSNNGLFNLLLIEKGLWYYVQFIYSTFVFFITTLIYLRLFSKVDAIIRPQALIMFLSSIFPWLAFAIMTLYKTPYGIDIAPFSISITSIIFLIGFFKFNFLDLKPIARDKIFEWSKDGIIIMDTNYTVIDFNEKAKKTIVTLGSNGIRENIKQYINGYTSIVSAYKNSQESQFVMNINGIDYYYSVKCHKLFDKKQNVIGYIVFLQDVTEQTKTLNRLNYIASTDELTGVFNRRYFTEKSQNEILIAKNQKIPLSFMILDLDYFKKINDTYGHLSGDEVIINVSKILKENTKPTDLLGRFGGEEFIILLPYTSIEEAVKIAERIRQTIEFSEVNYNGESIKVTASFGVTGTDLVVNEDLNTFLKYADKALYIAKGNGRNCTIKCNISD